MSEAPDFVTHVSEAPEFDAPDRPGLAKYLKSSLRYIEDLDAKREGPPRIKIAGRWRYPMPGVKAWLKAKTEIQCNAPAVEPHDAPKDAIRLNKRPAARHHQRKPNSRLRDESSGVNDDPPETERSA